jgi:hypothetical protein
MQIFKRFTKSSKIKYRYIFSGLIRTHLLYESGGQGNTITDIAEPFCIIYKNPVKNKLKWNSFIVF